MKINSVLSGSAYLPLAGGTVSGALTLGAALNLGGYLPTNIHTSLLPEIHKVVNFRKLSSAAGIGGDVTLTGSGTNENSWRLRKTHGVTASSYSFTSVDLYGLNIGGSYDVVDWDLKTYLIFQYGRQTSHTETIGYVLLTINQTQGTLTGKGFGIKVIDDALYGISYGTSLSSDVSLSTTLVLTPVLYQIMIVLDPTTDTIEWFVNGVSKATLSTAGKVPTGTSSRTDFNYSIENGATGLTDASSVLVDPIIIQMRS